MSSNAANYLKGIVPDYANPAKANATALANPELAYPRSSVLDPDS